MSNESHPLENIMEQANNYVETRFQLFKLRSIDKSSQVVSSLASGLIVLIIILGAVMLLSIGLSLWIGELLGRSYYGFFVVGGFYLLAGLIVTASKKSVKETIADSFIDKILN